MLETVLHARLGVLRDIIRVMDGSLASVILMMSAKSDTDFSDAIRHHRYHFQMSQMLRVQTSILVSSDISAYGYFYDLFPSHWPQTLLAYVRVYPQLFPSSKKPEYHVNTPV